MKTKHGNCKCWVCEGGEFIKRLLIYIILFSSSLTLLVVIESGIRNFDGPAFLDGFASAGGYESTTLLAILIGTCLTYKYLKYLWKECE